MRAVLWGIFGLALLMSLGFGTWAALQAGDGGDRAELTRRLQAEPQAYPARGIQTHLEQRAAHDAGYTRAALGGVLQGALLLAMLAAAVWRRPRLAIGLAVGVLLIGAGAIGLSPFFEMGLYGPAPPRLLAKLYAIPGAVCAVCILLLLRR
jgi:hypothetical protein